MTDFQVGDYVRLIDEYRTPGAPYDKRLCRESSHAEVIRDQYGIWLQWYDDAGSLFNLGSGIPTRHLEKIDAETFTWGPWGIAPEGAPKAAEGDPRKPEHGSRGDALANGERMREYGHPKVSFERVADLWSAYLSAPEVDPENLTAEDHGRMMILLKVSRSITDGKADTLDDIEGYVSCIRMLAAD